MCSDDAYSLLGIYCNLVFEIVIPEIIHSPKLTCRITSENQTIFKKKITDKQSNGRKLFF